MNQACLSVVRESLGQTVRRVLVTGNLEGENEPLLLLLSHEVLAYINMFGFAVNNIIFAGLDRGLIVNTQSDWLKFGLGSYLQ